MSSFALHEREATEEAAGLWWVFLLTGILWTIVALVIFRFDYTSVAAISYLFGFVAIFFGIDEFVAMGGTSTGWKIAHGLLGVIFVVIGVVALVHPYDTFTSLAALMSFFLVFVGTFNVIIAIATRDEISVWWLTLIIGILQMLLGFWAAGYFGRQAFLLVVFVAAVCLARGITNIVFAFKLHSLQKRLA